MEHFQSSWEGKSNDVNHVIIQTWLGVGSWSFEGEEGLGAVGGPSSDLS